MPQKQNLNRIDPFEKLPIPSLFPQIFPDAKDAVKSNDIEEIHQFMNSLALKDPYKHFAETKAILDGGSDFMNTKDTEDNTKENKDPMKKRPALARKRAKFSMKPSTSQPTTISEPSFQCDHLQDPEEFFAAYDRFEKATKELKRQRGEDLNEDIIPVTARQRRPEIPRRKAIIYQHHVYSSQPETVTSFSQETQDNTGSQHTLDSQQESVTVNCKSNEKEVSASVDKDKLFHELLSSNIASLDKNDAMSLLKNSLNIKDVDVETLQLPNFRDIPRVDLPYSVKSIKDQSILSDTHALSDTLKGKTLGKQKSSSSSDTSFISLASPKPPKSPFLAISALGKSLSKSIESNDPYSPRDIDLLPATTSKIISQDSTHVSNKKGFPVSDPVSDPGPDPADSVVENVVTEASDHFVLQKVSAEIPVISHQTEIISEPFISLEDSHEGDVAGPYAVSDIQTNEGLQTNSAEMVQKAGSATELNLSVEEDIGDDDDHFQCAQDMEENENAVEENETALEVNVEVPTIKEIQSHVQSDVDSADEHVASRPAQNSDIVPEQHIEEQPRSSVDDKRKKSVGKRKDDKKKRRQSLADAEPANERVASGPAPNSDIVLEQHIEEQPRTSVDKRKKTIAKREADKKKRRQSLAAAGSRWTSGVRRSNRIRTKPLEYWNGERLLYGRLHNSLPTVIGVKYLESNGKSGFKVESYVSDQYKELVEFAALH